MHDGFLAQLGHALVFAFGMFWKTGWTLVLGFAISGVLQATVSTDQMRDRLGNNGIKPVGLAALFGAASSSCSYASAAIMRTLFKKGAALGPSIAFLIASTNLVLELGIILYLLLGGAFTTAEWIGGVIMILVSTLIVKATLPKALADEARDHDEGEGGHSHQTKAVEGDRWTDRIRNPQARVAIAQNFTMEWRMLWKDLAIGFVVGGLVATFVPDEWWRTLFLSDAPEWLRIPANAVIGPVVAMLTFVCSIGNVPLAAVLWGGGASFGGVIAFLYADLIILPLLDAYRRYFGWRMMAYIGAVLFASMVVTGIVVDLGFGLTDLTPQAPADIHRELTTFKIDYTFWLNCVALIVGIWLFRVARRHPMRHPMEHHHDS